MFIFLIVVKLNINDLLNKLCQILFLIYYAYNNKTYFNSS